MPIARLSDRAVIALTGSDAAPFLQGLITNDIAKAKPSVYAALLTPQGKILFDFIVHADGDGYLLDAHATQAEDLLKRLKMYKLRAPVDLSLRPDLSVFAAWSATDDKPHDPRLKALGNRWIGPSTMPADTEHDIYRLHRLALGVPDSQDVTGEFLLDANGEELGAVDFRKGCFVGQEVTARMKHKAQPRRRIYLVAFDDAPAAGALLTNAAGMEAGEVKSSATGLALASLRIDRLAGQAAVIAGEAAGHIIPSAYALPQPAA